MQPLCKTAHTMSRFNEPMFCNFKPQIQNENNNLLNITMNSIKTTYILQKGLYNCNNFMAYLLTILPSSFSISINTITNKFTFTNTNTTYEFIISVGLSLSSSA